MKVVYRQGLTDEAVQIKAWLLRLIETEQENFYWDAAWQEVTWPGCMSMTASIWFASATKHSKESTVISCRWKSE